MAKVRVDQLTLGELALVEKRSGQSVSALGSDKPSMGVMLWLAYVVKRREDPTFSEQQAADLTLAEMGELIDTGDEQEEDPTP